MGHEPFEDSYTTGTAASDASKSRRFDSSGESLATDAFSDSRTSMTGDGLDKAGKKSGGGFLCCKKKKKKKEKEPQVGFCELFRFADKCDVMLMVTGAIAALLAGAGLPVFFDLFGKLVNDLSGASGVVSDINGVISRLCMWMAILGIGVWILCWIFVSTWLIAAERQTARIRERYFEALLRQEAGFHDENKPGGLSARLTGDTKVIKNGMNDKIALGIMNLGMSIAGYTIAFIRSWRLALVLFATMPFVAGSAALMATLLTKMAAQSRKRFARAGEISEEAMSNYKVVQIFGGEDREVARFQNELRKGGGSSIKKEFVNVGGVGLTYCIIFLSYALAFWVASFIIEKGQNNVGEIITAFFGALMGSFGLGLAMPPLGAMAEARGAAHKIYSVIDRESLIDPTVEGIIPDSFKGRIEFRNMTFSYPTRKETKLFHDLNLAVEAGTSVAFSGASGCGKSSLIALAQRLYDPDEGQVLVDGVDLRELDLRWWRSVVGVVSQEPNLFSGTVMDNILVGKAEATQEEVETACKQANIHDTIMSLPDGYHTEVGTVGSQLSGGQKQRLAIARAIVKDPKLLILDEATSALDRRSEVEVQAALDRLLKDGEHRRTVLVIAHRLATIRDVDRIHYVLHDGVKGSDVVENGTFDELVKKNGHFAHMVSKQSKSGMGQLRGEDRSTGTVKQQAKTRDDEQKLTLEERVYEEEKKQTVPTLRLLKMTLPRWWSIALGMLGSLISGGLYPAYAFIFSKLLRVLSQGADEVRSRTPFWAGMLAVIAAAALIGWLLQGFYAVAGEYLTTKLRSKLLRNVLRQDATFFDMPGRDPGSIGKVLSGDCESVHMLWGPSLGFKVQMACNLLVGLCIGLFHDWRVALVTAAGLPLMVAAGAFQQKLMFMGNGDIHKQTPEDTIVTESLTNIRTVMAFNQDEPRLQRYHDAVRSSRKSNIRKALVMGFFFGLSQFIIYGIFALAFWYGGRRVADGKVSFENMMIAAMAVLMGAMGAGEAGGFAEKAANASEGAKRAFALVDRVPDIDVEEEGEDPGADKAALGFDDVMFEYPARPGVPVLQGFNNTFKDRGSVGLMGSTGCGKSTIVQLLARYYDPVEGAVTVNGKDLRSVDLATWRSMISIVPQEPALFSGSVLENIRYSRPEATEAEVEEVARVACVHDEVVEMPEGYQTDVGYKGQRLSGGQKQRVALARGLLRKPKLLLLDEATSALDNATEAKVQERMMAAFQQNPMTVVSVAHRLTTIQQSEKIVLLENGVVLEEGTHDELMALGGDYKDRFDMFTQGSH